jgi:hypothetical protein
VEMGLDLEGCIMGLYLDRSIDRSIFADTEPFPMLVLVPSH